MTLGDDEPEHGCRAVAVVVVVVAVAVVVVVVVVTVVVVVAAVAVIVALVAVTSTADATLMQLLFLLLSLMCLLFCLRLDYFCIAVVVAGVAITVTAVAGTATAADVSVPLAVTQGRRIWRRNRFKEILAIDMHWLSTMALPIALIKDSFAKSIFYNPVICCCSDGGCSCRHNLPLRCQ